MMKVHFDEDELIALALFDEGSRSDTIASITEELPYIEEDGADEPEIINVIKNVLSKLKTISDEEYLQLDLDEYQIEDDFDGDYHEQLSEEGISVEVYDDEYDPDDSSGGEDADADSNDNSSDKDTDAETEGESTAGS